VEKGKTYLERGKACHETGSKTLNVLLSSGILVESVDMGLRAISNISN
jgi:hypothetical protein